MSYQFLSRKGTMIAFLVSLACMLVTVVPIIIGLSDFEKVPTAQQSFQKEGNIFYAGIYISGLLLLLGVAAALVLSVLQVVKDPKAAKQSMISFGLVLAVFLVLYFMADAKGEGALARTIEINSLSAPISKIIGAGIQVTIILGIASVVVAIALEVRNYFKNS